MVTGRPLIRIISWYLGKGHNHKKCDFLLISPSLFDDQYVVEYALQIHLSEMKPTVDRSQIRGV